MPDPAVVQVFTISLFIRIVGEALWQYMPAPVSAVPLISVNPRRMELLVSPLLNVTTGPEPSALMMVESTVHHELSYFASLVTSIGLPLKSTVSR